MKLYYELMVDGVTVATYTKFEKAYSFYMDIRPKESKTIWLQKAIDGCITDIEKRPLVEYIVYDDFEGGLEPDNACEDGSEYELVSEEWED